MDSSELKLAKERLKLLVNLDECLVKQRELERINDQIVSIRKNLFKIDNYPTYYLKELEREKEYDFKTKYGLNFRVRQERALMVLQKGVDNG